MKDIVLLIGRILMAPIFWVPIYSDITGFTGTAGFMAQKGMPIPGILLVGAIVFTFLGALLVFLGLWTRLGVVLLIVFLIPATLIFHFPWADISAIIEFCKNLGLIAGLLFLWVAGPGRIALRK